MDGNKIFRFEPLGDKGILSLGCQRVTQPIKNRAFIPSQSTGYRGVTLNGTNLFFWGVHFGTNVLPPFQAL